MKKLRLFLIVFAFLFSGNALVVAQKNQKYSPVQLPVPVLDSTGFIVDPNNAIDEEWKQGLIGLRTTYFFSRYVEPICVRVDYIHSPNEAEAYADRLVEEWDLEKKTNGRYVLQFHCKSKMAVVFRIGSQLKPFYSDQFLKDLSRETAELHFAGEASGTGDYVTLQSLGDHIFERIKYDGTLSTYEGNTGIHSFYPDKVDRSRELSLLEKSYYAPNDPIYVAQPESENSADFSSGASAKNYFSGLTADEIQKNFKAIKTGGSISDINKVPDVRKKNNSRTTNPHDILPAFAVSMIDSMLIKLEEETDYEVAVVCLNSIGDNDPHMWGTDLFNLWGIGDQSTENGLLILLVVDQHAVEFITGRGTEGVLTDGDCYDIQQNEMVPYFKQDDYVTGMIRGVQATCDFFYGSPPLYNGSYQDDYSDETYNYDYGYEEEYAEPFDFWESSFVWGYIYTAVGLSGAWIVVLLIAFFIPDLHKRYHTTKFFTLMIWMFLFPIPFVLIYFVTKGLMEKWRNTIRFSPRTGEEMHKLGDHEEDKHLSKGQISEEKVKSIDYDVWVTYGAKDVLILSYKKWFSKHSKCPKCSFKTYHKLYDRTITAATYTSSGTGERCYKCENCGHTKTERYTIPMKTRSSSSGSSSGGGGGYSRSYSSGGSSWGGGSSRGGGAGSRW